MATGACPPGRCGVGDYTRLLAEALVRGGAYVEVFDSPQTLGRTLLYLSAAVRSFRPDVSHLQYPTAGFGKGLTPQVFAIMKPVVLTVHEFRDAHLLRKLAFYPLWARALHVIFTCEADRECSVRWAPWVKNVSSVIPLSSSIPVIQTTTPRTSAVVIHFGLVRRRKGIEQVIEFSRLAQAQGLPFTVRVVGNPPPNDSAYLSAMQRESVELPFVWKLSLDPESVAKELEQATMAYLPFPDGASERRTSLLAALSNGVPVITTRGRFTPPALEGAVLFCSSPNEAVAAARCLLANPELRNELSTRGRKYAEKFSWQNIADAYISVYEKVLRTNANRN